MRIVIQLIKEGKIEVANHIIGQTGRGLAIFVGFTHHDDEQIVSKVIDKIIGLRLFPDTNGHTNLSLEQVNGSLLLIPNFTLYGSIKKGRRPSFTQAMPIIEASQLFDFMINETQKKVHHLQHGLFGAHMNITLVNDGPFTLSIDSDELDIGKT